jgi:putative transposase
MGRIARVVAAGFPHHVTQRGNRRQPVFFCEDDYRAYLGLMKEWCVRHGVRVWAYCLMPNHVHLILVPPSEAALCRAVGEGHRRYTRRVNFREKWRGHLWQGRFASFVMEGPYLMAAARYIERNPVRAKLAQRAEDWPFSSAAAHVENRSDAWAEGDWLRERTAGWVCTWAEYLRERDEPNGKDKLGIGEVLRRHESTGRPLGDRPFLERLGQQLGRNLLPQKRGPKPKEQN